MAAPFLLLDATLGAAVTAVIAGPPQPIHPYPIRGLSLYAVLTVAGGGTTAKAWVQTSFDNETTWVDIANIALTTATAVRVYNLTDVAVSSIATPTDGTLADNTSVNGLLGPSYRVKLTTTGTYTGATTFRIWAAGK